MAMENIESGNSGCIKYDHVKRYRSGGALIFLSAFLSLFIPSSLGGVVVPNLSVIAIVSSIALLLFNFIRSPLNICNFILFLLFACLLLLFTMLSKNGDFTPGAIFPYLGMWVVMITFPPDYVSSFSRKIFHLIAIILIVFGFGVVLGDESVRKLIFDFYQAYNDELYYFMVEVGDKHGNP